MTFEPRAVFALNLISSTDMPALAWDAIEAGLDGPAIRRMAALEFPTLFDMQGVLPQAMEEMRRSRSKGYSSGVPLTISRTISRAKDSSSGRTRIFLPPDSSESQRL